MVGWCGVWSFTCLGFGRLLFLTTKALGLGVSGGLFHIVTILRFPSAQWYAKYLFVALTRARSMAKSNLRVDGHFSIYHKMLGKGFSSVAQSCLTLCDPMGCSMPGLPVHHQFPQFTQTHVHWVGDAIQPSHPLSSPSPPTYNLSQHQGLFKSVSSV